LEKLHHEDKKEFAKQTTNLVDIESQKQTMQELPTPSKQDLEYFHKFFANGCCTNKRCSKTLCLELALSIFRNFIVLSKTFTRKPIRRNSTKDYVFD